MAFVQDIYHSVFFFSFPAEKEISFVASIPSEGRYFRDLLTPVTFYRYFRRFATFKGSLQSRSFTFVTIIKLIAPQQEIQDGG